MKQQRKKYKNKPDLNSRNAVHYNKEIASLKERVELLENAVLNVGNVIRVMLDKKYRVKK